MDLSRHRRILLNVSRVAKLCEVWIIVEGSRVRKINFPRTGNYLHRFSKYIKLLFARQCIWFISLVILVNEGDSSHPALTRVLAHSSCVRGTRTQPLICVGCSVHYWVSCAINKGGFLRLHFRRRRHTFASLWGACLCFASLWRANSRGDSCVLGVHIS